jgi:hypothetical protein
MRSMVEGAFRKLRVLAPPLHHPSGGPPPPTGEQKDASGVNVDWPAWSADASRLQPSMPHAVAYLEPR